MVHDFVTAVDPAKKTVTTRSGRTLAYDRLVLSPGIDVKYESVPGYSIAVSNQLPHAYTTSATTPTEQATAASHSRSETTAV